MSVTTGGFFNNFSPDGWKLEQKDGWSTKVWILISIYRYICTQYMERLNFYDFTWRLGWRTVEWKFKYTYIFHPLSNVSILNNKFKKKCHTGKKISFVGSQIRFRYFSRVLFITFWVLFGDLKFWRNVLTAVSHVWFHSQLIDPPLLQLFQGPILGWWITGKLTRQ